MIMWRLNMNLPLMTKLPRATSNLKNYPSNHKKQSSTDLPGNPETQDSNKNEKNDDNNYIDNEEEEDTTLKQQVPRRSSRKFPPRSTDEPLPPLIKTKRKSPANDSSIPVGDSPAVSDTEMSVNDITADNADNTPAVEEAHKNDKAQTSDTETSVQDTIEEN
eukprot:scaffold162712_cov60-Attheya_sp.AAC.2